MRIIFFLCAASLLGQEVTSDSLRKRAAEETKRLQESSQLPASRKRAILVELVNTAQEDTATDAMKRLIRSDDPEAVELSSQLVARLNVSGYVARVIASAGNYFSRSDRHRIARQLLRKIEDGYRADKTDSGNVNSGAYSAELLADSELANDQELVQSQWERSPEQLGYLNSLIRMGVRQGTGLALAQQLYSDATKRLWVRVAAAAILAVQDREARAFCVDKLDKLLDEFGSRDGMEMLMEKYRQIATRVPETRQRDVIPQFAGLPVASVGILQWLKTPDAERLTFAHLSSRNIFLNQALGMIAADRWPEHLIDVSSNPDEGRKRVLATLCVMHPHLQQMIEGLVPRSEFPKLLLQAKLLGVQGPTIVFDPGLVFFRR